MALAIQSDRKVLRRPERDPVAPRPVALPSPPAALGARVEPARAGAKVAFTSETGLLQCTGHAQRAEQGITSDEA